MSDLFGLSRPLDKELNDFLTEQAFPLGEGLVVALLQQWVQSGDRKKFNYALKVLTDLKVLLDNCTLVKEQPTTSDDSNTSSPAPPYHSVVHNNQNPFDTKDEEEQKLVQYKHCKHDFAQGIGNSVMCHKCFIDSADI